MEVATDPEDMEYKRSKLAPKHKAFAIRNGLIIIIWHFYVVVMIIYLWSFFSELTNYYHLQRNHSYRSLLIFFQSLILGVRMLLIY